MNNFKFKNINSTTISNNNNNNKGLWNNSYCTVIDSREKLKVEGINKLSERLNNIETLLNNYLPILIKSYTDNTSNNNKLGLSYSEFDNLTISSVSTSTLGSNINSQEKPESSIINPISLNNELNIKELIILYFTIQSYCTYPPIIDLGEFYEGLNSNSIPNYLLFAILSNASLNSPDQALYLRNYEYSNYYYKLSLFQLNQTLSNPTIYTVQTLLILSCIDEAYGKQFDKINKLTLASKLAQLLGMNKIEEYLTPELSDVPVYTIKKCWLSVKYWDQKSSSLMDAPNMIKSGITYEDFLITKSYQNNQVIQQCKLSLSQDYRDFFDINTKLANVVVPWFDRVEIELKSESASTKFEKCYEILNLCKEWKQSIPKNIQFNPNYGFNQSKILKNPLQRLISTLNQKYFELILQLLDYLIKLIFELEIPQALDIIQKLLGVGKELDYMLDVQQIELLKSEFESSNVGPLLIPKIFLNLQVYSSLQDQYKACKVYLKILKLNPNNNNRSSNIVKKLTSIENLLNLNYLVLLEKLKGFIGEWEGINLIIKKFENESEAEINSNIIGNNGMVGSGDVNIIDFNPIIQFNKY